MIIYNKTRCALLSNPQRLDRIKTGEGLEGQKVKMTRQVTRTNQTRQEISNYAEKGFKNG
jgi:hypothetical protein